MCSIICREHFSAMMTDMAYEDLKELKVTEIERAEFRTVVNEQFEEQRPDEFKDIDKETIEEAIDEVLAHKVFGNQKVRISLSRVIRTALRKYGTAKREKALDELETVDGYYFGGEDWLNSKDRSKAPDKQSVVILTNRGLMSMGVFGHSPSKEMDLVPNQKYRFTYSTFVSDKGTFLTIKRMEMLETDETELPQWLANEEIFEVIDLAKEDLYKPVLLEAEVGWIQGKPIMIESATETRNKWVNGEQVYDDKGRAVQIPKWVQDKNKVEDIIQATSDERAEDIHVAYWKLACDTGEDKEKKYVELRFYNKRLGRHAIDVEIMNDDDQYNDLCTLTPEEGVEFLLDSLRTTGEKLFIVAIPKKYREYDKDDGTHVTNVELTGLYVSDDMLSRISEVNKKKQ